jgi:Mn2+/Fe2+ NRAMP family transporter
MTVRTYALTSSIIFLLVAVLHLLRLALPENVMIGSWHFPMWASIVAVVVAGFLSFAGFRLFQAQRISLFR